MGALTRKPFQGIKNIIFFNWHLYLILLVGMTGVGLLIIYSSTPAKIVFSAFLLIGFTLLSISIGVSYYIYDYSPFYSLYWMDALGIKDSDHLANIHAGFDETSELIKGKYPGSHLSVYDFYDPLIHTEVSIKRARKARPVFPGTQKLDSSNRGLLKNDADFIFLILSAHEIRNELERIRFFKALNASLKKNGKILVVEHQRDLANFLSYTIGFLHFFSQESWLRTFRDANLEVQSQNKLTPFITVYTLTQNGTAS